MKTLLDPEVLLDICNRLDRITPASPRGWGRMTPHQMVCHLNDSFRLALGERTASPGNAPLPPAILKVIALRLPLPWPQNYATRPEMDQLITGTPPAEFAADIALLRSLLHRFADPHLSAFAPHPVFGTMSSWEWRRWGFLHADHHFRQFGL